MQYEKSFCLGDEAMNYFFCLKKKNVMVSLIETKVILLSLILLFYFKQKKDFDNLVT